MSLLSRSLLVLLLLVLLGGRAAAGPAQRGSGSELPDPIEALPGSLVLSGGGDWNRSIGLLFTTLAGGATARLVLLGDKSAEFREEKWSEQGVAAVEVVRIGRSSQLLSEENLGRLLEADGVWLCSDLPALRDESVFRKLLFSVLARGGVVGGEGPGAVALAAAGIDDRKAKGCRLALLPLSLVHTGYSEADEEELLEALEQHPGHVAWGIPPESALAIHEGRRVVVVGRRPVAVRVAARGEWPARARELEPGLYAQREDELPSDIDLLAWTRSARQRMGPLFPPTQAPVPEVAKGSLLMHGGSGVDDATWQRFIDAAGGEEDGRFVCIPTGGGDEPPDSYSAENLRERDCEHVRVLHTRRRRVAESDEEFLAPLREATGVWIDGGRTYRLMDSYQHTTVHQLLRGVLERGGIVAGSSAGCQVQGDFLLRGRPSSNRTLWLEGYETGFALLEGVILDAHFRQRDRQEPLAGLMEQFPQMLGIGVDEKTALLVEGTVGEVLGANKVSFFDAANGETLVLDAGQRYDLEARTLIEAPR